MTVLRPSPDSHSVPTHVTRHLMPPSNLSARVDSLHALLANRIAVLDGAMGTMIQRHKLTEAHYRGTVPYSEYAGARRSFAAATI